MRASFLPKKYVSISRARIRDTIVGFHDLSYLGPGARSRRPPIYLSGCQPRQCQHSVGNAEDALAQQLAPVTLLLLAHASGLPEARGLHGWRMHAQRRRAPVGRGGRARMQGRRARGQGVGLHVQVPQPRRRPAWRWWRHAHRQRQRSRQRRLRRGRVARGVGSAGGDRGARGLCRQGRGRGGYHYPYLYPYRHP
jgi:hypothetical protein